jgi:hypothetical protein
MARSPGEKIMRLRAKTEPDDRSWGGIYAAVADVALGKPWAAFDRVVADAHALLPPDVRACLATHAEKVEREKARTDLPIPAPAARHISLRHKRRI